MDLCVYTHPSQVPISEIVGGQDAFISEALWIATRGSQCCQRTKFASTVSSPPTSALLWGLSEDGTGYSTPPYLTLVPSPVQLAKVLTQQVDYRQPQEGPS